MDEVQKLKDRIELLEREIQYCIDFGCGFALCNSDHAGTRRGVEKIRDFLSKLIEKGDDNG